MCHNVFAQMICEVSLVKGLWRRVQADPLVPYKHQASFRHERKDQRADLPDSLRTLADKVFPNLEEKTNRQIALSLFLSLR